MSLLMEALRKAEEAKRRAAQGSEPAKPEPQPRAEEEATPATPVESTPPSQPTPTEITSSDDVMNYLLAEEPSAAALLGTSAPTDDIFEPTDTAAELKGPSNGSALDIPLGFSLDFAEPATEKAEIEALPPDEPLQEETPPTTDTLAVLVPELPSAQASSSSTSALTLTEVPSALPFGDDIFASLKLADAPPLAPEPAVTDFLLEMAVHATAPQKSTASSATPESEHHKPDSAHEQKPALALELTQSPVPSIEKVTEVAPTPIKASPLSAKETVKTEKFKNAVAAKKSVRALFASKTKTAQAPQKRLFLLGSIAAGVVVIVIGSWLALSLMTGSGNQYVIPPMTENIPVPDTGAPPVTELAAEPPLLTPDISLATSSVEPPVSSETALDLTAVETSAVAATADGNASVLPTPTVAATETVADTAVEVTEPAIVAPVAVAPATTENVPAPALAIAVAATPVIDPETGLIELPLDAGQSASGSVTGGAQAPIRISRSEPMRNPDMQMLSAWSAYQQGDYAAARIMYQQSLSRDPDNRDALLGVAASAMQQGDQVTARQTYNRLLNLNPRDPLARAGLLETTTASDPIQRETELKALKTDHPEIAAVSYSLGNLYASQQRWHDAQQAYYDALLTARTQAEGPVSPDYAFNLAISLERINQPEAALNFYREALALTEQHVPGFDMNVLDQRLRALERSRR
ncbi:MAG: tetratricopeptide repeat protein [Pseudohongiella sp.]|nr:tetratricopeptide repeat protein [Pseudohongiella sp.]